MQGVWGTMGVAAVRGDVAAAYSAAARPLQQPLSRTSSRTPPQASPSSEALLWRQMLARKQLMASSGTAGGEMSSGQLSTSDSLGSSPNGEAGPSRRSPQLPLTSAQGAYGSALSLVGAANGSNSGSPEPLRPMRPSATSGVSSSGAVPELSLELERLQSSMAVPGAQQQTLATGSSSSGPLEYSGGSTAATASLPASAVSSNPDASAFALRDSNNGRSAAGAAGPVGQMYWQDAQGRLVPVGQDSQGRLVPLAQLRAAKSLLSSSSSSTPSIAAAPATAFAQQPYYYYHPDATAAAAAWPMGAGGYDTMSQAAAAAAVGYPYAAAAPAAGATASSQWTVPQVLLLAGGGVLLLFNVFVVMFVVLMRFAISELREMGPH